MKDKVSVVLGKTAYEIIAGKRYRSDDHTYGNALDVLNIVLSDGNLYRIKDGEYHLHLDHLEGAFILMSDRFTDNNFFTVTYKGKYVPPKKKSIGKVSVEWKNM
jgi:hypothetical protein